MSVFKCKMCGGTIEFEQGASVGVCDFCGTKQTLPKTSDDSIANLFNRANNLRLKCEFDKAAAIYEKIVEQDDSEAEAHWGIVLCKCGIEYVDDPKTGKKIPTCHRTILEAITSDVDYKAAIDYSDSAQQSIYEEEARAIDRIQRDTLSIVQNEEPFDVFICYKETDENGKRTPDSTIANDIYYQLTQEGFKVFYAAITLEDKLGQEYEPYIFAALNSAKVMLAVGTNPMCFNAVWVRNEWSRYLKLMKNDRSKLLIPCYRDMDAYELPEEFAHLQAQDMSKIGFINDIVRGIKKVITKEEARTTVTETVAVGNNFSTGSNVSTLLERVFLFLEDGKWNDADIYCEKVLDIDPKNAEAYLGKLMAELQVKTRKQLADCETPFDDRDNYSKVLRFGNEALENEMRGYVAHINERNENARLTETYNNAKKVMSAANSEDSYKSAAHAFHTISGFKDADALAEQCLENAEICRKDAVYYYAKDKMTEDMVSSYEEAISIFQRITDYKDVDELINYCQKKIEAIEAKEEEERQELAFEKSKIESFDNNIKQIQTQIDKEKAELNYMGFFAWGRKKEIQNRICRLQKSLEIENETKNEFVSKLTIQHQLLLNTNIFLGKYPQDTIKQEKKFIEWRVLAKDENKILVISEYALDCQKYNTYDTEIKPEECSLRKWMNSTFLNTCFSAEEQSIILNTKVSADKNPKFNTDPGNATTDRVFLLSIKEVETYFSSIEKRKCVPTEYAVKKGAFKSTFYTSCGKATCWWWLRTPGLYQNTSSFVDFDGSIGYAGDVFVSSYGCVRPAMWIKLDSKL